MQKNDTSEPAVIDYVAGERRFAKFNKAIEAAGLVERFSRPGDFTVFAPTDEAVDKLPNDKMANLMKAENRDALRKMLLLHVVPGSLKAEDLMKLHSVKTEAGQMVKVDVSKDMREIKLANARVMLPKEEARNGVVYPLDTVLWPAASAGAAA